MAILFECMMDDPEPWRAAMAEHLPDMEFRVWPDVGAVEDIEYAIVWRPHLGDLRRYPNLKVMADKSGDLTLSKDFRNPQTTMKHIEQANLKGTTKRINNLLLTLLLTAGLRKNF